MIPQISFFEDVLCCKQPFVVAIPSREQVEKRTLSRALSRGKFTDVLLLYYHSKDLRIVPNYLLRTRIARRCYSGCGKARRRGTTLSLLAGYEETYLWYARRIRSSRRSANSVCEK